MGSLATVCQPLLKVVLGMKWAEPEPQLTDMSCESHQEVMLLDEQKFVAKMAMVRNPSSRPTLECH